MSNLHTSDSKESAPASAVPKMQRRRIPLASMCAAPHQCPPAVRMQVLERVPFFAGLSTVQLESIDKRMLSLSWAAGYPLFSAGESADYLYVLASGQVKLARPTAAGSEIVVDLLTPGDLFGSLRVMGQVVYPETAWALTTTCALRIDAHSFREILTEYPQVALRVLDDIVDRLAQARSDVGQQSGDTVEQRVASALLRLVDKLGHARSGNRGTLLQLPLSRSDLAGMVGSTPESVSRVMSRLRREGIIDSGRRWTAVLDHDRLRATANKSNVPR